MPDIHSAISALDRIPGRYSQLFLMVQGHDPEAEWDSPSWDAVRTVRGTLVTAARHLVNASHAWVELDPTALPADPRGLGELWLESVAPRASSADDGGARVRVRRSWYPAAEDVGVRPPQPSRVASSCQSLASVAGWLATLEVLAGDERLRDGTLACVSADRLLTRMVEQEAPASPDRLENNRLGSLGGRCTRFPTCADPREGDRRGCPACRRERVA